MPLDQVAALWQLLEPLAHPSFFLSWHWVGCWLRETDGKPDLLVAEQGDRPIGALLLCRPAGRWQNLVPSFHLTSSGSREFDAPFIEYNGPLVDRARAEAASHALLEALAALPRLRRSAGGWCLLFLPGIDSATRGRLADAGLAVAERMERPSPFVDLALVRRAGDDFLATRSRSFRWQVRRTKRLYEAAGPVRLVPAGSLADALATLEILKELHQRRWNRRGQPGAFGAPFFERFHRSLIAAAWPEGKVDLLRLEVGGRTVGSLYNFVHDDVVYAYQSGFQLTGDARLKPGLLCHSMAIDHYAGRGLLRYLLLAGKSDYKTSLATGVETLHWVVARRTGPLDAGMAFGHALAERGIERLRHLSGTFTQPSRDGRSSAKTNASSEI